MNIKINNQNIKAQAGQTILEALPKDVFVPTLCHHPDLSVRANCRVCVVELKDGRLVTACSTQVKPDMEIFTDTPKVKKARRMNLELIFSEHAEKCSSCFYNNKCKLQDYAKQYQAKITGFKDRKNNRKIFQFGEAVQFDQTKCIDCGNCLEMCEKQTVSFYDKIGKGADREYRPTKDINRDCTTCGQCIVHCPVGAIQEVSHLERVQKALDDPKKIVIAQTAPSIRVSIGEEFGMNPGEIATGKMVAGLKKLGFDYVFDTNLGADITTFEEAGEYFEGFKRRKMLFTSCCSAWFKFVRFYYPEFIPNISTVHSPQTCLGKTVKTYFAEKQSINPRDIVMVSIMPCVAKKFEITQPNTKINGMYAVDHVLTTREFAQLMKLNKVNFNYLKDEDFDHPLGSSSGAAAIYGATGGVMESALRTAVEYYMETKLRKPEFKQVRGMERVRKANIKVKGETIRVAVASGLDSARRVLEEIKQGREKLDFFEVMACPGGCIGGGGQPIPTNSYVRNARIKGLYEIDNNSAVRKAHENPDLLKLYSDYANSQKKRHHLFHTHHGRQKRSPIKTVK